MNQDSSAKPVVSRRLHWRRWLLAACLLFAVAGSASFGRLWARGGEIDAPAPKADAIFVPGMAVYGPREPHLALRARLEKALALWRNGHAPLIWVSGGHVGDHVEAEVMHEWLVEQGVPEDSIRLERESRTTRENGLFSAPLLRGCGVRRVLVVSQWFHVPRIRTALEQEGIETIAAPCQGPPAYAATPHVARELLLLPVHEAGIDRGLR